jgi:hypothetical protein
MHEIDCRLHGGELVAFPAAGGAATRRLQLPRDMVTPAFYGDPRVEQRAPGTTGRGGRRGRLANRPVGQTRFLSLATAKPIAAAPRSTRTGWLFTRRVARFGNPSRAAIACLAARGAA